MSVSRRVGLAVAVLLVFAPALLLLFPAEGARPSGAEIGRHTAVVTMTVGGVRRDYRLFVPSGAVTRRPLLVSLHQLHGSALLWEERTGLDAAAERAGVVVAYPDGLGHSWNAGTCCQPAAGQGVDDVAFLRAVIANVERRTPIDASRVAVTGFSNGGLMSYRLVCEAADVVHVAVAVAGDMVAPRCRPSRPVVVLHVHGLRDPVIPFAGAGPSRLDPSGFPAARTSVAVVATADRCSGGVTSTAGLVSTWTATGCATGGRVELMTSSTLGHNYPTGVRPAQAYGIDMPTLTFAFLRQVWR